MVNRTKELLIGSVREGLPRSSLKIQTGVYQMDKLGKAPQKTKQQVQRQRGGSNMPGPVRGSPLLVEKAEETFMGRISKGRMPVQGAWAWVVGTKAKSREVSDLHFNKTIHLVLK